MVWKIAPNGFVMPKERMATLPTDRVLREHRTVTYIEIGFIPVSLAKHQSRAELGEDRATVSELQGFWMKTAVVIAWHFACIKRLGKGDHLRLYARDFAAVPADMALMAAGDGQSSEWRFMPYSEALRIRRADQEHEHKLLIERMSL